MELTAKSLIKKIKNKTAVIGVLGIGYVGGAIAAATSKTGFKTIGFDINNEKIKRFNSLNVTNLSATDNFSQLLICNIVLVCVPTPTYRNKQPDLQPLIKAAKTVSKYLKRGQLVIIESTIAVGTTREVVLPILQKSNLTVEKDFFLSFSPERIDPGNLKYEIYNTPKIVSGFGNLSLNMTFQFYKSFIRKVVKVSSLEAAEMTKLLENTFRFINISLVNELSSYMYKRGLNIHEIINAAATKPYGFLAHYPGPGIGGHCIPVDPFYLLDDAKKHGTNLKMIEVAGKINDIRPKIVSKKTLELLKKRSPLNSHYNVLLVGVTYKPDVADTRESPALEIWKHLLKKGIEVKYHDPYINKIGPYTSTDLKKEVIKDIDLIMITTAHKKINFNKLVKTNKPIVDTRNTFNGHTASNIYRV